MNETFFLLQGFASPSPGGVQAMGQGIWPLSPGARWPVARRAPGGHPAALAFFPFLA